MALGVLSPPSCPLRKQVMLLPPRIQLKHALLRENHDYRCGATALDYGSIAATMGLALMGAWVYRPALP